MCTSTAGSFACTSPQGQQDAGVSNAQDAQDAAAVDGGNAPALDGKSDTGAAATSCSPGTMKVVYDQKGPVEALGVAAVPSGGFVVAGHLAVGPNDASWVARLDGAANMLWTQQVVQDNELIPFGVSLAKDGTIFLPGRHRIKKGLDDTTNPSLTTLSLDGSDAKTVVQQDPQFAGAFLQRAANLGSAHVLSVGGVVQGKTYDVWLARAEISTGAIDTFQMGGATYDLGLDIAARDDGGVIVLAKTDSQGAGKADGWLLWLDKSVKKTKELTFGGSGDDYPESLVTDGAGNPVVGGQMSVGGAVDVAAWSVDGKVAWTHPYTDVPAHVLLRLPLGGYATAGTSSKGTLVVGVLGSQGQELARISSPPALGRFDAAGLAPAGNGAFFVIGTTAPAGANSLRRLTVYRVCPVQ